MKTIEEAFDEWSKTCISALWGKSVTEFKSAFNAGAEYALANQWVSVEDRLPENGVYVIASDKYGSVCGARYNTQSKKWIGEYRNAITSFMDDIIYWMPIPEL